MARQGVLNVVPSGPCIMGYKDSRDTLTLWLIIGIYYERVSNSESLGIVERSYDIGCEENYVALLVLEKEHKYIRYVVGQNVIVWSYRLYSASLSVLSWGFKGCHCAKEYL